MTKQGGGVGGAGRVHLMREQPPVPVGERSLIDVGGRRLNVWQAGERGPVVLLVHGIPTNHLLWHDVVGGLHEQARVVAVDLLGYGWSDPPGDWHVDLASQAGHLLALLDALGIERASVVGHDLGGGIAQILAVTSGDRVEGMAVVNGVCFDAWPVPGVKAVRAAWPAVSIAPAGFVATALGPGIRMLFSNQEQARRFTPWFTLPWSFPGGPARLARHLRSLDSAFTSCITPFLPRLAIPVEVLWGRRDTQLPAVHGERLAATVPTSSLILLDEASHFVPGDQPSAVVHTVRRLLDRTDPERSSGPQEPLAGGSSHLPPPGSEPTDQGGIIGQGGPELT